jgi:hypothetical protein
LPFCQTHRLRVRLIGYWRSEADDGWPEPHELVDEAWDDGERDQVASYLEKGFFPWTAAGVSECRLCGRANGSAELTDGVYLRPEGPAHYVREHSVTLPADVLAHIERCQRELESLEVDRDWWPRAMGPSDAAR